MKLAAKFINKMVKHIDNNSVPRRSQLLPRTCLSNILQNVSPSQFPIPNQKKQPSTQLAASGDAGKHKANVNKHGQKKQRKEFSGKSLNMGLFHVKKGTPTAKALPSKSKLKDGQGICHDFCLHEKSVPSPISYARMGSITPTGKMSPTRTSLCFCPT